jgi:hypothetical protein
MNVIVSISAWVFFAIRRFTSHSVLRGNTTHFAIFLLGMLGLSAASESYAVPAFARQTGLACVTCHNQNFPALNAFGRAFKSGGYTLNGAQEQIKGEGLSIPSILNGSLVTKIRYQRTNGDDNTIATNGGEFQFPDEAALLFGGRVSENIGYLLEFATIGEANTTNGKVSLFGSYKMAFTKKTDGVNLLLIPYSSDEGGAGYGFELLNTGATGVHRVGEEREGLMAQQYLGLGAGPATGIAFVAANPMGFVNLSMWSPIHGSFHAKKLAPYLRAAWTPNFAGWDTGLGFQYYSGSAQTRDDAGALVDLVTKGWSIDGQLQGKVGDMPLGVYGAYGKAPANTVFNSTENQIKAASLHAQLTVLPQTSLLLGYRAASRGTATDNRDNAVTIGGIYLLTQNLQLQLNHVMRSGNLYNSAQPEGDRKTTLMLFGAW